MGGYEVKLAVPRPGRRRPMEAKAGRKALERLAGARPIWREA